MDSPRLIGRDKQEKIFKPIAIRKNKDVKLQTTRKKDKKSSQNKGRSTNKNRLRDTKINIGGKAGILTRM